MFPDKGRQLKFPGMNRRDEQYNLRVDFEQLFY